MVKVLPKHRTSSRPALAVKQIHELSGASQLTIAGTRGPVTAVVPATPDERQARRWLATVRRIDRVVIHVENDLVKCRAIGHRSRLPFTSPIRLCVALGLGRLGVPLVVTGLDG